MIRVWDREKNLSVRQKSNPWPPEHRVGGLQNSRFRTFSEGAKRWRVILKCEAREPPSPFLHSLQTFLFKELFRCFTVEANRSFPSSLMPLFQNESKCETFHMKMGFACSFIFMQNKVIFIRMVSHLDSLWNRDTRELKNGLFWVTWCLSFNPSPRTKHFSWTWVWFAWKWTWRQKRQLGNDLFEDEWWNRELTLKCKLVQR